jgi:rhodanese-related sulfurtransferase
MNVYHGKLIVLLIALLSMSVWADIQGKKEISSEAKSKAPHISAQQLATDLAANKDFLLLDIRTEAEFEAGHIQNAKWLPRGKLEFGIQELTTDPNAQIVLYCGSGGRSALATLTLNEMGYGNAVDLEGGFKAWMAEGHSLYNMHGELKAVPKPEKE